MTVAAIQTAWHEVVLKKFVGRTQPVKVDKKGWLLVIVKDKETHQEIVFYKNKILTTLLAQLPECGVKDIRFRVDDFADFGEERLQLAPPNPAPSVEQPREDAIKPIPTRYKGYHFRSRLEARWAVLLDALSIPWEYEPEGFMLDDGGYLPDFRTRFEDRVHWLEVKPPLGDAGKNAVIARVWKLVRLTGIPALVVFGDLRDGYAVLCRENGRPSVWSNDPLGVAFELTGITPDYDSLQSAIDDARSARFEHGESGAT